MIRTRWAGVNPANVVFSFGFLALSACGQGGSQQFSGPSRVERVLLATVTDTLYPGGAWAETAFLHVNRDSTFIVRAGFEPPTRDIYFAGKDGHLVRQVGGRGEGPGEFMAPFFIMEGINSYFIVDSQLLRLSRFSKKDLALQSTARIPVRPSGIRPAMFPDESYIMYTYPSPAGDREPFHLIDSDGRLLRSFGKELPEGLTRSAGNVTTLSVADDSTFWASYQDSYRLEKWSRGGRLLSTITRDHDLPFPSSYANSPDSLSMARVWGTYQDLEGRLWVYIKVTRRVVDEVEMVYPDGQRRMEMILRPDPSLTESVIEVLDASDGSLIASDRVRRDDLGFQSAGGFFQRATRTTGSGYKVIDVWGARLVLGSGPHMP